MTGQKSVSQQPLPHDTGGMCSGQVLLLCGPFSASIPISYALEPLQQHWACMQANSVQGSL